MLWLHFGLTLYFFAVTATANSVAGIPHPSTRPREYVFRDFRSANAYVPFASFPTAKYEVEFAGSDDGGMTWKPYLFRYKPQRDDRMSPFLAPRFARFETSLQLALYSNSPVILRVARKLLERNPDVMSLFETDPFPDRPANMIRILVYKFSFTDLPTYRRTGRFWDKHYESDLVPPIYWDASGRIGGGG